MLLAPHVASRTLTERIKKQPKAHSALSAGEGVLQCTHLRKGVGSTEFTDQPQPSSGTKGTLLQSSRAPHPHHSHGILSSPSGTALCTWVIDTEVALRRVTHPWPQGPARAGYQRPLQPREWTLQGCWARCSHGQSRGGCPCHGVWQSPSLGDTVQMLGSPYLTLTISVFSLCWKSCLIKRLPASCHIGLSGRIRN